MGEASQREKKGEAPCGQDDVQNDPGLPASVTQRMTKWLADEGNSLWRKAYGWATQWNETDYGTAKLRKPQVSGLVRGSFTH